MSDIAPQKGMVVVWDDSSHNQYQRRHIENMIRHHGEEPMEVTSAEGTDNAWLVKLERNGKPMVFGSPTNHHLEINWADLRLL